MQPDSDLRFEDLGLPEEILGAVRAAGYEAPSSIQAEAIPPLLAGRDLLGQAQTGTGKTAAFALPILARLDLGRRTPQALVLTPTRELALQVAEAMQTYARGLDGFHVLPVYGGQSIDAQLRRLRRGVHVVVGTPGRLLDHLRRQTLDLGGLRTVVLDEADEMLRMGFLEDVEKILQRTPEGRQVALFSATLPGAVARIAGDHLDDPAEVRIASKTATVAKVDQFFWKVSGTHKLDALTRILEVEDFDAMLVFVRTKLAAAELAEKLEARGFASAPLHGDMSQALRERAVERLRDGKLDIVVATDVAARGLDVDRISHVVNYDVPYDTEAYIHRIGRTGRAGRSGKAILFVAYRERRMLRAIEKATRQTLQQMELPSRQDVAESRIRQLVETLQEVLEGEDLGFYAGVVDSLCAATGADLEEVAAGLAYLAQRDRPLQPQVGQHALASGKSSGKQSPKAPAKPPKAPAKAPTKAGKPQKTELASKGRPSSGDESSRTPGEESADKPFRKPPPADPGKPKKGHDRYRVDVGGDHGIQPKNLVGAISNESGLDHKLVGAILIYDEHSTVELPEGMPKEVLQHLKKIEVFGRPLRIELETRGKSKIKPRKTKPFRPGSGRPKPPRKKGKGR